MDFKKWAFSSCYMKLKKSRNLAKICFMKIKKSRNLLNIFGEYGTHFFWPSLAQDYHSIFLSSMERPLTSKQWFYNPLDCLLSRHALKPCTIYIGIMENNAHFLYLHIESQ